jgi:hypothetical protein
MLRSIGGTPNYGTRHLGTQTVLGPFTLETSTLGTQLQVFGLLCLPPTYLATTLDS